MQINTQLFALPHPPPQFIAVAQKRYALVRVFKHDFYAATCLYQLEGLDAGTDIDPNAIPQIVVKFGRTQVFCGLPMDWYGRWLRHHEETVYRLLKDVPGVPRWVGRVGETGYAIEYINALPLDHVENIPAGFFDRLRTVFDAIHARGIAYCDGNKRSNILVDSLGRPWVIDYQISIWRQDNLPWPLGAMLGRIVAYLQGGDMYHLYKHKRRLCPGELTPEEAELSHKRGLLHTLHRKIAKPWRDLRRRFLQKQYQSGRLQSPSASLEDHHQPEKETWRKD